MYKIKYHTNLSVILKWSRQPQVVSQKHDDLNVNED